MTLRPEVLELIDGLPVPVLVVDASARICRANRAARELYERAREEVGPGDAIGCVVAGSSGRCGASVHCQTCVIRTTVLATFSDGLSRTGIPAYPEVERGGARKTLSLLVSAEKVDDCVVLRLEDACPSG
ncbi:MAG: hypothetical protein HY924_08595 [Elusimicrobia bacterium]|nr:hypothetical protein [Elusimicrobiota bacterium]